MSRFLWILLSVTAVMHVPVALGVAELARRLGARSPGLVGTAWALLGLALFVGRARAGMPDRRRHGAIVRLVDLPYFVHWCAAVWTLVTTVIAVPVTLVVEGALGHGLHVPMAVFLAAYLSGLVVSAYGVLVRRRWFRVVEREVHVSGLPAAFDGLRVAHLSDLHVGTLTPRAWGLRWSHAANALAPDVAVVTGDMVTSGADYHDDVADVVGALRAPHGVYASMGNHDYFGDEGPLVERLTARGVRVLRNAGVALERGGAQLWLAAIDDTWTRRDDIDLALAGRPEGATTILLAHDPQRFDQAADAGAALVLSGHTHGGQVAVPFAARSLNPARLGYPYSLGFYRRGRSTLYVHPGLGTTGPPIRLGAAPEVTLLVLRAGERPARQSASGAETHSRRASGTSDR